MCLSSGFRKPKPFSRVPSQLCRCPLVSQLQAAPLAHDLIRPTAEFDSLAVQKVVTSCLHHMLPTSVTVRIAVFGLLTRLSLSAA